MMISGSLPTASTYGTWLENIELRSIEDDSLWDTSMFTEIQVKLRDPRTGADELTLRLSGGSVTLPSPGIIQWRAEAGAMGTLPAKTYQAIILLQNDTDTVPLLIGTISIIGEGVTFT
jgi:hypothetical protein